ncbi:MAG TPA: amidase [Amycolatopsis sp.]|nr:amidase [Amycolatopsis sp.]
MTQLHELPAARQLIALRDREISSRELTEHYLSRIDRFGAELGAFVTIAPDLALDQAKRADAALTGGESLPLLGLPIAVKDLYATAGIRTTFGSAALAEHVPQADSWTVGLLRRAGAVVLGKTNTPEFGTTCYTENQVTPRPAVTPYSAQHYSSGSSGGAATAVAAGLLPVAHGSDGAGSIRTPAAACHLVGVKPSRGLVSPAPASSYFATTIEGPIARTVGDAAVLLDVMAQAHPGDLFGWHPAQSFAEATTQEPTRPLRIAMWVDTGVDGVPPHPEAVTAVRRTAALLRELGHRVDEIAIPARCDERTQQAMLHMFGSAVAAIAKAMLPAASASLLTPFNRHLLAIGEALTGSETVAFQSVLAQYATSFLTVLSEFDFALTPTTNGPPVPPGHYDAEGPEHVVDRMLAWSCHTPWANLTGAPAITLASHLDDHGMPHGFQLVGHQRGDARLLALAAALESAAPQTEVHPTCWRE